MYLPPAEFLNQVANSQTLKAGWTRRLFTMNQQQLNEALAQQAKVLLAGGVLGKVAASYQALAPLLVENKAISRYIEQTGSSDFAKMYPEVVSVDDALLLADLEYELSTMEKQQLAKMLYELVDEPEDPRPQQLAKQSTNSPDVQTRRKRAAEEFKKVPPHLRARVLEILQHRRQRALEAAKKKG